MAHTSTWWTLKGTYVTDNEPLGEYFWHTTQTAILSTKIIDFQANKRKEHRSAHGVKFGTLVDKNGVWYVVVGGVIVKYITFVYDVFLSQSITRHRGRHCVNLYLPIGVQVRGDCLAKLQLPPRIPPGTIVLYITSEPNSKGVPHTSVLRSPLSSVAFIGSLLLFFNINFHER